MKRLIVGYKLFILLFIFWILLTFNFKISNLVVGIIASTLVTYISYGVLYEDSGYSFLLPRVFVFFKYIFVLLIQIYKSSISHIVNIIKNDYSPTIVRVDLDVKDPFLITLISNSITLTPGTITVDSEGNSLLVLTIKDFGDDGKKIRDNIKNTFEHIFFN